MDAAALEMETRVILDDTVSPYQFLPELVRGKLNEAMSEACIRTRVLQDSGSTVTRVALVAGQAEYSLDPSIFAVRRVRIEGVRDPLEIKDTAELDHDYPGWDDDTITNAGTPRYAVFDYSGSGGSVRLSPRPTTAATLCLTVWRGPSDALGELLEGDGDEPPLPLHMHRELKHWAAAMCLLNPDQETQNVALANAQLNMFEAAYGTKPSLHEIRLWSTNRRRRMRACFD